MVDSEPNQMTLFQTQHTSPVFIDMQQDGRGGWSRTSVIGFKGQGNNRYTTPHQGLATTGGVEPPFAESESAVLPLNDVAT